LEARDVHPEHWFETLLEVSPIGVGVISVLDNRYVYANQPLADLYGMSIAEVLACEPFSMALRTTHPDDLASEQKLFAELVAGARRSYRIDKRIVRADGSVRFLHASFAGVFDRSVTSPLPSGAFQYAVIQVVDITDAKQLAHTLQVRDEELRHAQKVDGLGRLAAGIAHDFNNLLTVIIGHGEVLKRQIAGRVQAGQLSTLTEGLDAILAAAGRATDLTTQLLAHGRRGPVNPRVLVLSRAVEGLRQLLGRTLAANVEIEHSLEATGSIVADEGQIGQVLLNLVLNACDAMPSGGRLSIQTRDVDGSGTGLPPDGPWVALTVSDTGHGMTPEVQARMFEPFFTTRDDRSGSRGTGLGCATVQRIVAESGGHIDVRSAPGRGTAVTIFLPRVASAPLDAGGSRAESRPAPRAKGQRILVVEDEPAVRSLIGVVLLSAQYWLMVARDGEEALRFIESEPEPFDLIVTDVMMPGLSGPSLAKRLAERGDPARMLFVSGYSDHSPAELMAHGELLTKPFTPDRLLAAVARALGVTS
jgi:PAS domain S-box-containing protein